MCCVATDIEDWFILNVIFTVGKEDHTGVLSYDVNQPVNIKALRFPEWTHIWELQSELVILCVLLRARAKSVPPSASYLGVAVNRSSGERVKSPSIEVDGS